MFWDRGKRWRIVQWFKRQRSRIIWAGCLLAALAIASQSGVIDALDRYYMEASYRLEGERPNSKRVMVVEVGRDDDLVDALKLVQDQSPALTVVELDQRVDGRALPCDEAILYISTARPRGLPGSCAWQVTARSPGDWMRFRLYDVDGTRTVAGRVVEKFREASLDEAVTTVAVGGSVPRVRAAALAGASRGLFGGRVVFVQTDPTAVVQTPHGWVTRTMLVAEGTGAVLSDDTVATPGWLAALLSLSLALFGAVLALRPRALLWTASAVALLATVQFVLLVFGGLYVGVVSGIASLLIGVLVVSNVSADRAAAGREVRLRLASAIKHAMERSAHRVDDDAVFWSRLLNRVRADIDAPSMALAKRRSDSWWIAFKAFVQMTEDDIGEQRRDIRRVPYQRAFESKSIDTTANYMLDDELQSILVPLVADGETCGLWVINHPQPDRFMEENKSTLRRVADQLAAEVRAHLLAEEAREIEGRFEAREEDIIDASLAVMENLELERRALEEVLASSRVGLMMTNLFGEVSYENTTMRELLANAEVADISGVAQLLVLLAGIDVATAEERLEAVVERAESIAMTTTVTVDGDERVYDLRVHPAMRRRDGRDAVHGLIVTATDISSAVESDRSRLHVVEVINTRAADLLNVLAGYANVLAMSDNVAPAERALVEGLRESLGELERVVRDFDQVASNAPAALQTESIPLSVQYTVREALRGARQASELPHVRYDLPDRPLVARGHPETIQNAIRVLILDAVDLVPADVDVDISVGEGPYGMEIRIRVPDVSIPNDLLQRMLDAPADDGGGSSRLYTANNYVRAGGGRLIASSSLADGLQFRIILPRND